MPQLRALQYLRGLAMALVVAAHVQSMWQALSPAAHRVHHVLLVFLHGGAIGIFFVLSGFLFHHHHGTDLVVSSSERTTLPPDKRGPTLSSETSLLPVARIHTKSKHERILFDHFDSVRFIQRRFGKIGLPYLITCTPVLLRRMFLEEERRLVNLHGHSVSEPDAQLVLVWKRTLTWENLQKALSQLCDGRAVIYAYWFIPVMLGLTLLSPLVVMFLRCSSMTQATWLVFSYLVALMAVGRPTASTKPQTWQLILYFWPVYLTGTLFSVHREKMLKKGGEWIKLGTLFVVLLGQIEFGSEVAGHVPLVANGLGLLQLLWTCWLSFGVFQRYNQRRFRLVWLHNVTQRLADASLEIYLLHPWVICCMYGFLKDWNVKESLMRRGWLIWVFETSVVLFVCVGISTAWRCMVGKFRFQCGCLGRGCSKDYV